MEGVVLVPLHPIQMCVKVRLDNESSYSLFPLEVVFLQTRMFVQQILNLLDISLGVPGYGGKKNTYFIYVVQNFSYISFGEYESFVKLHSLRLITELMSSMCIKALFSFNSI